MSTLLLWTIQNSARARWFREGWTRMGGGMGWLRLERRLPPRGTHRQRPDQQWNDWKENSWKGQEKRWRVGLCIVHNRKVDM